LDWGSFHILCVTKKEINNLSNEELGELISWENETKNRFNTKDANFKFVFLFFDKQ